jgi:phosphoserine phosphatase
LDPRELPYRENVLTFLREEKTRDRILVLATAAHVRIAEAVANHLQLFDRVIATDDSHNLKGPGKLAAILRDAPDGVFDYAGDSRADLPIFREARESILVHPSRGLLERARETCRVTRVLD